MVNEIIVLPLNGREYPIKFGTRAMIRLYKKTPAEAFGGMSSFELLPLLIEAGANPADNLPTGDDLYDAIDTSDPAILARIFAAFNEAMGFFQTATTPPAVAVSVKPKAKK